MPAWLSCTPPDNRSAQHCPVGGGGFGGCGADGGHNNINASGM